MKIILTFFIFLSCTSICFAKGVRGFYYITGTARDNRDKPLQNKTIQLIYNGDTSIIKTSKKGEYIAKIEWEIPCMSGGGGFRGNEIDRENFIRSFNSHYLIFVFGKSIVKVENVYQMFIDISKYYSTKEDLSYCQDLKFEK